MQLNKLGTPSTISGMKTIGSLSDISAHGTQRLQHTVGCNKFAPHVGFMQASDPIAVFRIKNMCLPLGRLILCKRHGVQTYCTPL
jgi:hypothetical protein